jgi:hypothetical protein
MNIIEEFGALVSEFTGKAEQFIAKAKEAEQAEQNPPETGRPFMKGVNEPEEGQKTYYRMPMTNVICEWEYKAANSWFHNMLCHGELYPTEADCIEGEKRKEIRARYDGMGRPFCKGVANYTAYWHHGLSPARLVVSDMFYTQGINVWFDTKASCQAAIDAIDREYGEGAFKEFVLGVRDNG